MILTEKYIKDNRNKFVLENVTDSQFSQNSIDLSLGKYIFFWHERCGGFLKMDISKEAFVLKPNDFVLAYTDEWVGFKANTNICWEFKLKSTSARLGLNHSLAGFVESGYFLPLCLELTSFKNFELKHGDLIGQAIFHLTTDESVDYSIKGNYQKSQDLEILKASWQPEEILPKTIKNKFV